MFFACKRETSERSTSELKQEVETLIQEATFTFPRAHGVGAMLSGLYKSQTSPSHRQAT